MAQYSVGSKVVHIGNGKRGTIIEVYPPRRGRQVYKVGWLNGNNDELEADIALDCDISDPFERCASGIFGSYSEYAKKNTTFKIKNSNNSTISSLKASKTLFRAYQFKPLLKFLNSPNRRLLVADEVGLGKTIEAGHVMLELKARRELRNVLIVCPKSLQEKWKVELIEKFGLSFKIYESAKDLISELEEHHGDVRAIINYEKIRMKRDDENNDNDDEKKNKEKEKKKKREKDPKNNLIDFLLLKGGRFSLVLCDEAHKMRNNSTQTYKGAEIVMSLADASIFLTATPIMISTRNLYNLLHLLDNTRYFNPQIFDNLLQQNKPFIWALTELNHNEPLKEIAKKLSSEVIHSKFSADEKEIYSETTTVGEKFKEDPLFKEIIELMNGEDSLQIRAKLQHLLSSMSIMNNVFSRTRKREITTDYTQAERKPHLRKIVLTDDEREKFDSVIDEYIEENSYQDYHGETVMEQGAILGLIQKKRQIASSVYAYLNNEDNLEKGIDEFCSRPDSKIDKLVNIIEEVFKHGTKKLVVFALFRKTLYYIKLRLAAKGYKSLMIHGLIENRAEILDTFKKDPNSRILLSSEVGSEGLDMQFCNSMVNYDLPWNPMVVEQRIGRIDRFGQQSPIVNIYNLVVADSIQEEIYMRLLDRIGIFRDTIGDLEAILDAPIDASGKISIQNLYNKLETELYTSKLTPAEKKRKIEEVQRAIENERENIKHLEEGLTNTLTNDAYFKDEINRILNNNAYVTEIELKNYIESIIRQELTTCDLVEVEPDVYDFKMPLNNPKILINFLTTYQPDGDENEAIFSRFKNTISDKDSLRITFSQQKAYDNRSLMYLNIYHPIIQASLNYFIKNDDRTKTSFCYAIKDEKGIYETNLYYMAIYQLSMHRIVQGVEKRSETLLPLLYNVRNKSIVTDKDIVNSIFSKSQVSGIEHNASNNNIDRDMIQDMRYDFAEYISNEVKNKVGELNNQAESERFRNEQQTIEYYKSRIENYERNIDEWEQILDYTYYENTKERRRWEGAIRLAKANISQLEHEMEEHLNQINNDPKIGIESEIISINLINIL
jgi:SNF2 family DNA or RNA helicase